MVSKKIGAYFLISCIVFTSCSLNKMAINAVSNALTGSGSVDVFTSDSDLILVGDALPFAIKMYETLLSQNPNHQGLLLTTGSLFIMYANAFVQGPADMLDPVFEYFQWEEGRERARQLYLRGYDHLTYALERRYPGIGNARADDGSLAPFVNRFKKDDVPLIYWTVAGGLSAYILAPFDNFDLGMKIPDWYMMMAKAYELDPEFNNGAIDEFYIHFYASEAALILDLDKNLAYEHFLIAIERTGGLSAGPYVAYAEAVNIPEQDYQSFLANLQMALAINVDDDPPNRLMNILSQRKARHLLWIEYELFPGEFPPPVWDDEYF